METVPSIIPEAPKPTVNTTRVLRPHVMGLTKMCCVCAKPQAHWTIEHARYGTEIEDICALCFLYESGWLVRERVQRVEQVAKAISLKRGTKLEYALTEQGDKAWPPRLLNVTDADSVLGAIALHDRFEGITNRRNS